MKATRKKLLLRQRGFTALEVLVVLIVSIAALALSGQWIRGYSDNLVNQAAAEHAKTVAEAATRYINDNYAAVLALATPKAPVITVEMLQKTNYLPPSFTATNPYGQAYSIWALQAVAGKLQTLIVTTGGEVIGELNLRRVAQLIGAQGGHLAGANATGSYGGWTIPLADYGLTANPGHLAVALFFQDGAVVSDYLYRNAVPGHPELNQMTTPLHMRAQASENTSDTLCAVGDSTTFGRIAVDSIGAVLSCQSGVWRRQGAGYWKDPVATYATLPSSGNNIGDVRLVTALGRAFTWNGTGWNGIAVDQNGNLTVPGTATINALNGNLQVTATATEGAACSGDGRIASSTTTSGQILSCQSGVWSSGQRNGQGISFTGDVAVSGTSVFPATRIYSNTLLSYTPTSSQVTIQKSGNYYLWAEQYTCLPGSGYAMVAIYVNNNWVAGGVSYPNSCDSSSGAVFLSLAAGNVVTGMCGDNAGRLTSCFMTIMKL